MVVPPLIPYVHQRSKRRKGDLARRVANTVGGFRVERTGSDKIPSSSAEARPANLDSCAPEDRTQVEGEQPDVSVMGCCSGVPSAKTHIQHGFTREMGRIGASALGSSRLPRVLIWVGFTVLGALLTFRIQDMFLLCLAFL